MTQEAETTQKRGVLKKKSRMVERGKEKNCREGEVGVKGKENPLQMTRHTITLYTKPRDDDDERPDLMMMRHGLGA